MTKYQVLLFMFRLHNKQYLRPNSFYLPTNSQNQSLHQIRQSS